MLVVRCVSVEKMDAILDICRDQWPDDKITVLTNGRRFAEIADDPRVDEALHLPELDQEGFNGVWSTSRKFRRIVVPLGNASGVGFTNVFCFLSWIRAREWFIAPRSASLKPIAQSQLKRMIRKEQVVRMLSSPLASILSKMLFSKEPSAEFRI